ncbi:uncharacterized protein LOC117337821 [Pecten maximus]|uniref:uncharacterized protein LOC117337821 n=1 Tax=Pecten maximus TaxID=6579 RepID=UPI001458BA32|nr:uncharacterized protein LOC117337821 [Pecten maximus]
MEKKRLQGISTANIKCLENQKEKLERIKNMKHQTRESIKTVQTLQERLGLILLTDDWIKIILEGKETKTKPTIEDLTTLPGTSTSTDVEQASDCVGSVYRHKSLETVSSIPLSNNYSITCIAPVKENSFWAIINKEIQMCKKQGIIKNIRYGTQIRGIAITVSDKLLATCTDDKCVKKITSEGKQLHSFSTDPLIPNQLCVASNGDILVTLVSSFEDPIPETVGVVSRYTPQGKRMITFERDRFGNTICPKYVAASRVSDMVVVTTHTNNDSDGWFYGHVMVMTGDLQVKFRYLGDGQFISGDQQFHQESSTKHFSPGIDSKDHIILGDIKSGSVEIIDKHGHRLQCLGQVDGISYLTVSIDDQLWVGLTTGQVQVYKYT